MRIIVALALTAAVTLAAGRAAAQPLNTCTAGKIKCVNTFTTTVFKCVAAAYKKPPSAAVQDKAQACVRKARQKFGTAVSPKPGCIDKVEAKEDPTKPESICPAGADEYDLDEMVVLYTESMQGEISPVLSPVGSSCNAGKFKCVGAMVKGLLACQEKAFKQGVGVDESCWFGALDKFSGNGDPAKGCFVKLEAKQKLGKLKTLCGSDGNTTVVRGMADVFASVVVDAIIH